MNKKGFTLIELLAVLTLLAIVVGISIYSIGNVFKNAKEKSEDAFVATLSDALEMYLTSSDAKTELSSGSRCDVDLNKSNGKTVNVYNVEINFNDVINSQYKPLTSKDFVNPANKKVECLDTAPVTIYRDDDYVYYYSFERSSLGCLTNEDGMVTNLPQGFDCE